MPQNAQDYATATLEAWVAGDGDALERLMTVESRSILLDSPVDATAEWQFQRCEGAAGSAYCTFEGGGDTLTFQVANQAAATGQEQAVIGVRLGV